MSDIALDPQVDGQVQDAPEGDAWSGPSQEEWQQVVEGLGYLSQQFQPPEQVPSQQEQAPAFDPFAENATDMIREIVRGEMAPLVQHQYGEQLSEAEERAYDIIDSIVAQEGEFANKDFAYPAVRSLADSYMQEEIQRHGFGPQAAEAALQRAAKDVRAYEASVQEAAIARYTNQLSTLSGAAHEPGTTYAQGAQQRIVPDYRQGGTVTQRFFGTSDQG